MIALPAGGYSPDMNGRKDSQPNENDEDQDAEPTLNAPGEAGPTGIVAPPEEEEDTED